MPISISSSIEYCKEGRIDYTWLAGVHGCHFLELIQEIHLLAPRAVLQQQLVFIFEDVAFDEGPLGDVLGVALRRRNLQNKMEPPVNHRIKKNQIPLDSFWDSFRVLRALSGGFFLLFFSTFLSIISLSVSMLEGEELFRIVVHYFPCIFIFPSFETMFGTGEDSLRFPLVISHS